MAERYGELPTTVMDRPFSDFWVDAGVMKATDAWRDDVQERQKAAQTDAGVASPQEKNELVQTQEARADRREAGRQPSPDEQMEALGIDVEKRLGGR